MCREAKNSYIKIQQATIIVSTQSTITYKCLSTRNTHPAPTTPHPASRTHHPSPIIHHPSPIIHHPSPITHHPSPITHQTLVIRHLSSTHRLWDSFRFNDYGILFCNRLFVSEINSIFVARKIISQS